MRKLTVAERLAKYSAVRENGCIEWTGSKHGKGYGQLSVNGMPRRTSRIAYELAHGPIPHGMLVCHHCDNRACHNVAHLYLGTAKDNTQDMLRRGRHGNGEGHGHVKLTDAQVAQIRALRDSGMTYKDVAARFPGTPYLTVYYIARGLSRRLRPA